MLQALRDPTRSDHGRALASLDEHVANPSFVLVMMHVFSSGAQYAQQGLTTDLRQLAGLIIKNYVFKHLVQLPVEVQTILKREVVRVLQDSIPDIRKTAAILAGKISESFPVATWSDMLPPILQMLSADLFPTHGSVLEGGLEAMQRICEDSALKLALDDVHRPLDALIPKLLALLSCSESSVRISALRSYNALLYLLNPDNFADESSSPKSQNNSPRVTKHITSSAIGNAAHPLIMHMNAFITQLAGLSTDADTTVRTLVCQAITTISTTHVAVLDSYFPDICVFMLAALADAQECVAIEACEFWAVMLESSDTKQAIETHLPPLVRHLVSRLYLTAEQMETERVNEEAENSGEKELNLRPIHHRNSSNSGRYVYFIYFMNFKLCMTQTFHIILLSSSAEDAENAELSAKWTLRKQAALLLDTVAVSFPPADVLAAGMRVMCVLFVSQRVS